MAAAVHIRPCKMMELTLNVEDSIEHSAHSWQVWVVAAIHGRSILSNRGSKATHWIQCATDYPPQRVPCPIIKPVPEIVKSFFCDELSYPEIKVWVKFCRNQTVPREV